MPKHEQGKELRNHAPVEVGDLVKCTFLGSPEWDKKGLVLERIYYVDSGPNKTTHPDEYNCRVLFDRGEKMVRAKWLRVISKKNLKESQSCVIIK